ncbi:MAG: hypothetical protein HOP18_14385 [Deltaproteobacteria bacterium]|nr:hypothetical protein [Deltaproteobacteria bacterium]
MTGKQLRHVLSVGTLSLLCVTQGVRADIQNAVWESPLAGTASGLQAFRGHVSSSTGAEVTVRLLIPSLAISLQLPWGTERGDVAASGPDRFSGFGDVLNVGNLQPGGPVAMAIEMREGGGTGACTAPTCVSITRSFTVVKPGARAGEVAQFRFAQDFAAFADLTNPSIPDPATPNHRPSNVATDPSTTNENGGPDIIIAPVTIQDTTSGGGGFRTATLRQRWVQNTQSFEIISAVTSDPSFSAVQGILGTRCGLSGCHVGVPGATTLPALLPLNNSTNSFFNTVALRSLENPQMPRITPGKTAQSYLFQKIIAGGAIAAGTQRMPPGCSGATCLSASEISTIENWIINGAPPPIP